MNNIACRKHACVAGLLLVFVVGCGSSSSTVDVRPDETTAATGRQTVTFYVEGMNKRLKIL